MKFPAGLARSARPAGIRSQLLVIVLVPLLLTTLGLVGYFNHPSSGSHVLSRHAIPLAPGNEVATPRAKGRLEAGITSKRDALLHSGLMVFAALMLGGLLAWRLSRRLSEQIAELNRVVEAAAELEGRVDSAARANVAKSRFFAAASHDLRQPMHALSLFVSALKARNHQPEVADLVGHIEDATATMEVLFNSLLDISRLDAGVIEARPVHFPLQRLLDDLDSRFAAIAAEKGLRLRVRPCSAHLRSDPLLLERILNNLVSNAIRHTDDGGVLVGCRRLDGCVRIGVWDSGRGIPQDQQQAIFQEFVQLQNAERDRAKGLGLGLAIVSRLGNLLGHRVQVHSQPGRGSLFSVDVPCGDAGLAIAAVPAVPSGMLPTDMLVALIDDENAILHGMGELFDNWNIGLVAARNAEDTLQWLAGIGRMPDVIVSDYHLPGDSDGLEVIARIRRHFGREIPAVVISGDTAPDTLRRVKDAGLPLLHKPLRPAKLRALLGNLAQQNHALTVG